MKKQYKIQLPKGKKVTMTNVDFENGVMTVNVDLCDTFIMPPVPPKDGDFVYVKGVYEHIAIYKNTVGEDMYVYANWNMSFSVSKIIMNDLTPLCCIQDLKEIRPATEEKKKSLIDKLAEKGKKWNKWTKSIEYIEYIPQDGDIVTMPMIPDLANFLKAKKYIAIYKREDIEGKKIYCYFIIGQHRNGDTFVFKEDHITDNGTMISEIKLATKEEKNLLFDKLAESGKRWNEETKTIEDVMWRAEKGKPYYYIIGLDNIVGTTDERLVCDENRYATNNYFKTREAAEKVAEQIREVFKNSKTE